MMRRFSCCARSAGLANAFVGLRSVTSYDTKPLSHTELVRQYPFSGIISNPHEFAEKSLIPSLEAVEERVAMWRLNRWELRVPALLTGMEKEYAQQQLHQIRKHMTEQCEVLEAVSNDKQVLQRCLNVRDAAELSGKNRAWLQEKIEALRWEGRVADAKEAREAWIRLEKYGNRDFRLLERVCAIYGMGRLNTFSEAFSNFVSEDPTTKKLVLEKGDPFSTALGVILSSMPTVDVCYEFLGLSGAGYIGGLKRYARHVLTASRHSVSSAMTVSTAPAASRILYSSRSEVLFDLTQTNPNAEESEQSGHATGDLLFVSQGKATLISIASPNRHVRSLQVPSRRQMEGIIRRLCLTLDIPLDEAKIQFLYLPPSSIDAASIARLHRVLGLHDTIDALAEKGHVPEWVALYDKELPASEVDYVDIQKKFPEEEWVML